MKFYSLFRFTISINGVNNPSILPISYLINSSLKNVFHSYLRLHDVAMEVVYHAVSGYKVYKGLS